MALKEYKAPGVSISEPTMPGQFPRLPEDVQKRFPSIADYHRDMDQFWRKARSAIADSSEDVGRLIARNNRALVSITAEVNGNVATALQNLTAAVGLSGAESNYILDLQADVGANTAAITDEATARASADSALATTIAELTVAAGSGALIFVQSGTPTATHVNDLWYDTTGGNFVPKYWNGTAWVLARDSSLTGALADIATAQANITTITSTYATQAFAEAKKSEAITAAGLYTDGQVATRATLAQLSDEATARSTADTAETNARTTAISAVTTLANNAQTTANSANSAAAAAQSSANAALAELDDIASDSLLTPDEKPRVIMERDVIVAEQAGIDTQATAFGITTEKTSYDNAVAALTAYLATLTSAVLWSNLAGNTTIVGATFRTKFSDVYTARQVLLNRIYQQAKALADAAQTTASTAVSRIDTEEITRATADTALANRSSVIEARLTNGAYAVAYTSNFAAGADGWTNGTGDPNLTVVGNIDGIGGLNDVLRITLGATNTSLQIARTTMSLQNGRRYRLDFSYNTPVGSGLNSRYLSVGIYNPATAGLVHQSTSAVLIYEGANWLKGSLEFYQETDTALYLVATSTALGNAFGNGAAGATLYLRDIVITPLEAAAVISSNTLNGGFTTAGAGGADVFSGMTEFVAGTSAIVRDTATVYRAGASCRMDIDASNSAASLTWSGVMTAGVRYRLRFWHRHNKATPITYFQIGTGGYSNEVISMPSLAKDTWRVLEYEFTAWGSTFSIARPSSAALNNCSYWIDEVSLVPLTEPTGTLARISTIETTYATQTFAEAKKTEAITAAASYTDSGISAINSTITTTYATKVYADGTAEARKTEAISSAASYTDSGINSVNANITTNYATKVYADGAVSSAVTSLTSAFQSADTAISGAVGKRITVSNAQPALPNLNDLWIDTSDSNKAKFWDGAAWQYKQDGVLSNAAANAQSTANSASTTAGTALTTANSKNKTFIQGSSPTATSAGDLWFNSSDGYRQYRWDGAAWVEVADTRIASSASSITSLQNTVSTHTTAIASLQTSLNSLTTTKSQTFAQSGQPTAGAVGDIWIDTGNGNIVKRWSGSAWVSLQDLAIGTAQSTANTANAAAGTAQATANGKNKVFYQASAPTATAVGDLWVDSDDNNRLYRWDGATWALVADTRIASNAANITTIQNTITTINNSIASLTTSVGAAQTTADSKVKTWVQGSTPTAAAIGDLWVDTANGNSLKRWNGSTWVNTNVAQEQIDLVAASVTSEINARVSADNALASSIDSTVATISTKARIFAQASAPTATAVGDIWFDTDDNNQPYRWSGSAWVTVQDGDIAVAQSAANTAQATANAANSAANAAQTSANSALAKLDDIASDSVLTPDEKPALVLERDVIVAEQAGIDTQATAYGITTEKTAYDNAVSALTAYLATLTTPVLWSNLSGNTTIVGATFRTKFSDVYTTRQTLLNKIYNQAKALADTAQATAGTAQTTANTKVKTFVQSGTPTATTIGDLWVDTANGNALKRWGGASWDDTTIATGAISAAVQVETNARVSADGLIHAQWGVSINMAGAVTGRIHLDGTGGTSEFMVDATKFTVYNGTTGVAPFQVVGGQVRVQSLVLLNTDVAGLGALATANTVDLTTGVTGKSLAALDSTANTKLSGIAAGADVTLSAINGGLVVTGGGITLSAGGAIKGGASDFSTGTGFFLGYEGGTYKFRVGNPSGARIQWDGSNWTVVNLVPAVLASVGAGGSAASSSYTNVSPDIAVTVTCDGTTRVFKFSGAYVANASGGTQTCYVAICDGTTVIGELGNGNGVSLSAGQSIPIEFSCSYTPSAGSHTFRIRVKGSAGASVATGGYLEML